MLNKQVLLSPFACRAPAGAAAWPKATELLTDPILSTSHLTQDTSAPAFQQRQLRAKVALLLQGYISN